MMALKNRLDICKYLLARARLTGDDEAVQRFSENRLKLVKQIADLKTHLRLV